VANSNLLKARGVSVDTVKNTARAEYPGNEAPTFYHAKMLEKVLNDECFAIARSTIPDPGAALEAHASTLIADRLGDFGRNSPHKIVGYRNYFDVELTDPYPWDHLDPKARDLADMYMISASDVCHARCYFSTEGGRLGIGPRNVQPGDVICVLLRRKNDFCSKAC
jgi:hypothetical protein